MTKTVKLNPEQISIGIMFVKLKLFVLKFYRTYAQRGGGGGGLVSFFFIGEALWLI